jgi:hypothetical protein
MGFYIRKSVSVGPLRFNLSESGIGVSAGVRGLRFGTGPWGNYVHMGRGGLYYRQTLPSVEQVPRTSITETISAKNFHVTHGPMESIASTSTAGMADSSSMALLSELEEKRRRILWWPIAALFTLVTLVVLFLAEVTIWILAPMGTFLAVGVWFVYMKDLLAKSVVIMYDLDNSACSAFEALHDSATHIGQSGGTWHLDARAQVYDRKYHAGASELVQRKRINIGVSFPPRVRTNVDVVRFSLGGSSVYLFPERLIVYGSDGIGAIAYDQLRIDCQSQRFIEEGSVPTDATIVDRTWRYVNKKGGPDRRFNNNRELPVCLYEEIRLTSASGLNEIIQVSRIGFGKEFRDRMNAMAETIHLTQTAEADRQRFENDHKRQDLHNGSSPLAASAAATDNSRSRVASPTLETICEGLLQILCCVMVSDGRASRSERLCISELMQKLKSPWSAAEIDKRIDEFIAAVMSEGYQHVLAAALLHVDLFKHLGRTSTLIQCIEAVARADGAPEMRESQLCERIRQMVCE